MTLETAEHAARVLEIMKLIEQQHGIPPMDDLEKYITVLQFNGLIDRQRAENMRAAAAVGQ